MTELEQTIIDNTQQELALVLAFYRNRASGMTAEAFDAAWRDYLGHFHAMNALIAIAHQAHSGLSEEAVKSLCKIEDEHINAYRALAI